MLLFLTSLFKGAEEARDELTLSPLSPKALVLQFCTTVVESMTPTVI